MPHIQNKIRFWESKPKKEIPVKHLKNSQGSPPPPPSYLLFSPLAGVENPGKLTQTPRRRKMSEHPAHAFCRGTKKLQNNPKCRTFLFNFNSKTVCAPS